MNISIFLWGAAYNSRATNSGARNNSIQYSWSFMFSIQFFTFLQRIMSNRIIKSFKNSSRKFTKHVIRPNGKIWMGSNWFLKERFRNSTDIEFILVWFTSKQKCFQYPDYAKKLFRGHIKGASMWKTAIKSSGCSRCALVVYENKSLFRTKKK